MPRHDNQRKPQNDSQLAGVSGAQVEDLVGAAGQPAHDLGDPGGGGVGSFAWLPADLS